MGSNSMTFSSSTTANVLAGFSFSRQAKSGSSISWNHLKRGYISEITNSNLKPVFPPKSYPIHSPSASSQYNQETEPDEDDSVEDLRVPNHWLDPLKASEESEWLRVTLHKWLDDEYCPEETNIKISEVASGSFYKSLKEKKTDLGEILLEMAQELSTISYQESFHGAFSSANAAVNLIIQRIQQD